MSEHTTIFQTFDPAHLITIGVIFAVAGLFVLVGRHPRLKPLAKPLGVMLAVGMLANEAIYIGGAILQGRWHYSWGLPLQLCDLSIFAVAYSLVRHKQWVWELAYFWGLGGTLQAVLTPDLRVDFPSYIYFKFFITHGCILIGVIFLSAGLKRPITFRSAARVFVITNLYAAAIGMFNAIFKTNYLYLCRKPFLPSVMDYLGPWPWYLLGVEGLLVLSLFVYYLPYHFYNKRTNSL